MIVQEWLKSIEGEQAKKSQHLSWRNNTGSNVSNVVLFQAVGRPPGNAWQ
jgi:hypothetical protein